ncbi:MAG: DUF1329 domain-containing protein [Gammaproteobacteria bacterium]
MPGGDLGQLADQSDNRYQLWRVSEDHVISYYDLPALGTTLEVHADLQRYRSRQRRSDVRAQSKKRGFCFAPLVNHQRDRPLSSRPCEGGHSELRSA